MWNVLVIFQMLPMVRHNNAEKNSRYYCAKVLITKAPITKAPITKAPITKAPITKAPIPGLMSDGEPHL